MFLEQEKKFTWKPFLLTQLACGLFTTLCALLLDNSLRHLGIEIHPWKEALISGAAGTFFATLFVPLLWRLGLVTIPQYILGAIGLFIPATLLSLFAVYQFHPIIINFVGIELSSLSDNQNWAVTIYIRIFRSTILFPAYIFAFWLIYHKYLGNKPL